MKNHYEILGLKKGCSDADVKKAYKMAAQKHHPDKNKNDADGNKTSDEIKFSDIKDAYDALKTKAGREYYELCAGVLPSDEEVLDLAVNILGQIFERVMDRYVKGKVFSVNEFIENELKDKKLLDKQKLNKNKRDKQKLITLRSKVSTKGVRNIFHERIDLGLELHNQNIHDCLTAIRAIDESLSLLRGYDINDRDLPGNHTYRDELKIMLSSIRAGYRG